MDELGITERKKERDKELASNLPSVLQALKLTLHPLTSNRLRQISSYLIWASKMVRWIKALPPSNWYQSPEPTWWERRTDSTCCFLTFTPTPSLSLSLTHPNLNKKSSTARTQWTQTAFWGILSNTYPVLWSSVTKLYTSFLPQTHDKCVSLSRWGTWSPTFSDICPTPLIIAKV